MLPACAPTGTCRYGLKLHMWAPPATDVRRQRPAFIYIHGGGFKEGDRNDKAGGVDWCQQMASRGYARPSIPGFTRSQRNPPLCVLWGARVYTCILKNGEERSRLV